MTLDTQVSRIMKATVPIKKMKTLRFPKPVKRIKKKKLPNRVRKTPLAKLKREADKLAGEKCRARGACENPDCLSQDPTRALQWAHVIARSHSSKIRWDMDNCFCLCAACHFKFTKHPDLWHFWLEGYYPGLHKKLMSRIKALENVKINRDYMEKVIKRLEAKG